MSILTAIKNSNKVYELEDAFKAKDATGALMREQIRRWLSLYYGDPDDGCDPSQRIPVLIVNKLYKTVFSEYECTASGSQKVFLDQLTDRLDICRKKAMQFSLIGGECFIKPVITSNGISFTVIRRDAFLPFARDMYGRVTDIGTAEFTERGGKYYTLAERRTVTNGKLVIQNRLFRSDTPNMLGVPVPLTALEEYSKLLPEIELEGIYNLGIVSLRTPLENTVDGSGDAVSVYAPAVGLIENINRNEAQLNTEFENGMSRIIVSDDLLKRDGSGRKRLTDSVFTAIDDDPESAGITIYNPTLRESSFIARKQEYLRNIESLIGFKRGILSEVEAAERTATEITSSAGDYNLTIMDFQQCWETTLRELMDTCVRLGRIYGLVSGSDINMKSDIAVSWGDGVLYNRDKTWQEYVSMVQSGLLKPEIALAWYFDMPCENEGNMQKIREKYMPELQALAGGE